MSGQKEVVSEIQDFILEFIKNESILVAYKQEDTKYFLAPSKAVCTLQKNERSDSRELSESLIFSLLTPTYNGFKETFIECSEEEYQAFITNFMNSEIHEIQNFYIELNTTKLHYVFDTLIKSPEE
jgi:hypothetical protein